MDCLLLKRPFGLALYRKYSFRVLDLFFFVFVVYCVCFMCCTLCIVNE